MDALIVVLAIAAWLLLLLGLYGLLRLLEATCPPFRRWVAEWDDEPGPGKPW